MDTARARARSLARLLRRRLWGGLLWRGTAVRGAACEETTSGGGGSRGGRAACARRVPGVERQTGAPPLLCVRG